MSKPRWTRSENLSDEQMRDLSIDIDFRFEEFERQNIFIRRCLRFVKTFKTARNQNKKISQSLVRLPHESKKRWTRRKEFIVLQTPYRNTNRIHNVALRDHEITWETRNYNLFSVDSFDSVNSVLRTTHRLSSIYKKSLGTIWFALELVLSTRAVEAKSRKSDGVYWTFLTALVITFGLSVYRFYANYAVIEGQEPYSEQFAIRTLVFGLSALLTLLTIIWFLLPGY